MAEPTHQSVHECASVETIAFESGLTAGQAQAFFLYCEGLSVEEIAERLGVKPGAVQVRLVRVRKRILEHAERLSASEAIDDALTAAEERKRQAAEYPCGASLPATRIRDGVDARGWACV